MSGYNISPELRAAAIKRGIAPPDAGARFFDRAAKLWSRVNVPAAGQTQFLFFNEALASGVTNVNQGALQANQVFVAKGMRFSFLAGIDRSGVRLGLAASTAVRNASSLAQSWWLNNITTNDAITGRIARWAEKTRELLQQGTVKFNIGEREVFNIFGLDNFPQGKGVVSDGVATNATTTAASAANATFEHIITNVTNGERVLANRYNFTRPVGIFAGQNFNVTVDYPRSVAFDEADIGPIAGLSAVTAGTLMCELEGELITPVQ